MNQFLYDVAEQAWETYDKADDVTPVLLYAWLLAEIHFAGNHDVKLFVTLDYLPDIIEVITLWYTVAIGYREFRYSIRRKEAATYPEAMSGIPAKT